MSLTARKARNLGSHTTLPAVQHFEKFKDGTQRKLGQYLTKARFVGLGLDPEAIDTNKNELTRFTCSKLRWVRVILMPFGPGVNLNFTQGARTGSYSHLGH
jgi:hypothetical protein